MNDNVFFKFSASPQNHWIWNLVQACCSHLSRKQLSIPDWYLLILWNAKLKILNCKIVFSPNTKNQNVDITELGRLLSDRQCLYSSQLEMQQIMFWLKKWRSCKNKLVECRLKPDDQEFTIFHVLQQSPYAAHYTEGFRVSNIIGIRLVLFQIFARCPYLFFIY